MLNLPPPQFFYTDVVYANGESETERDTVTQIGLQQVSGGYFNAIESTLIGGHHVDLTTPTYVAVENKGRFDDSCRP